MNITDKKIELTKTEKENFEREFKTAILYQLYSEKLLTIEQFKKVLNAVE
ncbi:MAG: hypothetical protein Q8942_10615 [Bacillota bacterium]|nr:hypothetical protein [Bacillota bacterium]